MTSESKSTVVLVPGGWHKSSAFDSFRELLTASNFPSVAVGLPTNDVEPPATAHATDDAQAVRDVLEQAIEKEGKNVVLVVHSYGGQPGGNGSEGYGYPARAAQGKKGGIIMFLYLTSLAMAKGETVRELMGPAFFEGMIIDENYVRYDKEGAAMAFNPEMSPEDQMRHIDERCTPHMCLKAFDHPTTHEPWQAMPCGYVLCRNDVAHTLEMQERLVARLGENCLRYYVDCGHSPWLTAPDKLLEAIEDAAVKGLEKAKNWA